MEQNWYDVVAAEEYELESWDKAETLTDAVSNQYTSFSNFEEFYDQEVRKHPHSDKVLEQEPRPYSLEAVQENKPLNCFGKAMKTAIVGEKVFDKEFVPVVQYDLDENETSVNGHIGLKDELGNEYGVKSTKDKTEYFDESQALEAFVGFYLASDGYVQYEKSNLDSLEERKNDVESLNIESDYLDDRVEEAKEILKN